MQISRIGQVVFSFEDVGGGIEIDRIVVRCKSNSPEPDGLVITKRGYHGSWWKRKRPSEACVSVSCHDMRNKISSRANKHHNRKNNLVNEALNY